MNLFKTNEEYIKSLNISNLSTYLSTNNIFCPKGRGSWCDILSCKNCIEEWLRQPHIEEINNEDEIF